MSDQKKKRKETMRQRIKRLVNQDPITIKDKKVAMEKGWIDKNGNRL